MKAKLITAFVGLFIAVALRVPLWIVERMIATRCRSGSAYLPLPAAWSAA